MSGAAIKNKIYAYKKRLGYGVNTAPIRLFTQTTDPRKIKGIYTAANAFVLPSQEADGLPYLESLSSAVPVIANPSGGQMDFLNARNSFLSRL